jgi:hypothetical protein
VKQHVPAVRGEPIAETTDPPPRRCWSCDAPRPEHAIGWESDMRGGRWGDSLRDLCPRHRMQERPAIATLGELVSAHREKKGCAT